MKMITESKLRKEYLEYRNNYLTVESFAEHRGISIEFATAMITEGDRLHEEYVEMVKSI